MYSSGTASWNRSLRELTKIRFGFFHASGSGSRSGTRFTRPVQLSDPSGRFSTRPLYASRTVALGLLCFIHACGMA